MFSILLIEKKQAPKALGSHMEFDDDAVVQSDKVAGPEAIQFERRPKLRIMAKPILLTIGLKKIHIHTNLA